MPLRPTTTGTTSSAVSAAICSLYITFTHNFFSTTTTKVPLLRILTHIPCRYRPKAIQDAQAALTDYLHSTRALPFTYAEHIGRNAPVSLSLIISQVPFKPSTFLKSMHRFLRYHPINEFEFFYESIGIDYKYIDALLPVKKFFLSEDSRVFDAACVLADFGFPWNRLSILYIEKVEIFEIELTDLRRKLTGLTDRYGFNNVVIVGICLAFPHVLTVDGEIDELLSVLRRVFIDKNLLCHVEGNVDASYDVCRKIKLFYELCSEKGMMGELLVESANNFVDYSEDDFARKIEFFSGFGVDTEQVGLLLLTKPEILNFDLGDREISVSSFLKHFNLCEEKLKHIEHHYPYVLGKNKIVNVPHTIRAVDLGEWFFDSIRFGDHDLLNTYADSSQGDDDYKNNLNNIQRGRTPVHTTAKLDFLHSIGFGKNKFTVKVLKKLHGSSSELHERFNCLLLCGIKFSKVCRMIYLSPSIINQKTDLLERKVEFLCEGMGSSIQYLDKFPGYLLYDLEKTIKPRYEFYTWLKTEGWCKKEYSLASMIATSEKSFLARISVLHPDAPKKWFEKLSKEDPKAGCQEMPIL